MLQNDRAFNFNISLVSKKGGLSMSHILYKLCFFGY